MSIKKLSLLYKTYRLIKTTYVYLRDMHRIRESLYSDELKVLMYKYLKTVIHKDWLGRLYGVVNPSIVDGKLDISNVIIEIDGDNTNNDEYVKIWVYKQLQLIAQLFKLKNLYDYIDLTFKHVGPENQDNFLLIFDVVSRKEMSSAFKSFMLHAIIYAAIAVGIIIYI